MKRFRKSFEVYVALAEIQHCRTSVNANELIRLFNFKGGSIVDSI